VRPNGIKEFTLKIDIFAHVMPEKFFDKLTKKIKIGVDLLEYTPWVINYPGMKKLDYRFNMMNRYPEVLQVISLVLPPLEVVVETKDSIELAKAANEEMAEMVVKYPDRFAAAVATVPLNDVDAAIKETDRAINDLGFKGIQIFSNIDGQPIDSPQYRPLFERMAQHKLPIWIHPWNLPVTGPSSKYLPDSIKEYFRNDIVEPMNWPFETTLAMLRIEQSTIFTDYPDLKIITHHCGGMIPFFATRIKNPKNIEILHKFYADTAIYGNTGALMCGYNFWSPDRMLFGTDMMGTAVQFDRTLDTIDSIERMGISQQDKDKIYFTNAQRLLKLPSKA
jgi:uncharacterized protein